MELNSFADLVSEAKRASKKTSLAVVAANDEHTLESVVEAANGNIVSPILIGDESKIKALLEKYKAAASDYRIIPTASPEEALKSAISLINKGEAEAIMKGALDTGLLMKAIVSKENNLNKGRKISVVGLFELKAYPKILAVTDMGITTHPDLDGKRDILLNAVEFLNSRG